MFGLKSSWQIKILELKSRIATWQGRCGKIILNNNCFRVSLLWLLWNLTLDMSTWLLVSVVFFLHVIRAAQRPTIVASLINKITDHESVSEDNTCSKTSNSFRNLLLRGLASHSQSFKGNFVVVVVVECYIITLKLKMSLNF